MIPQSPTGSSAIKEVEAQRKKRRRMRNEGQKWRCLCSALWHFPAGSRGTGWLLSSTQGCLATSQAPLRVVGSVLVRHMGGAPMGRLSGGANRATHPPPQDQGHISNQGQAHGHSTVGCQGQVTFQPWISSHFILTMCTTVKRPGYNHIQLYC